MKRVAASLLALTVVMELLAISLSHVALSVYTFVVAFAGAGALLLAYARQLREPPFRTGLTLIGLGYLLRALGEWQWGLGLLHTGDGYSFPANLPFYLTSLLYAAGAYRIYGTVALKKGLSRYEVVFALAGALGLVAFLSLPALDQDSLPPEFWIETLDNVVSAFAALLMVIAAGLTHDQAARRWAVPLGLVFTLFLVGNTLYTISSEQYAYGALPDFFWLGETAVLFLMVVREGKSVAAPERGR